MHRISLRLLNNTYMPTQLCLLKHTKSTMNYEEISHAHLIRSSQTKGWRFCYPTQFEDSENSRQSSKAVYFSQSQNLPQSFKRFLFAKHSTRNMQRANQGNRISQRYRYIFLPLLGHLLMPGKVTETRGCITYLLS